MKRKPLPDKSLPEYPIKTGMIEKIKKSILSGISFIKAHRKALIITAAVIIGSILIVYVFKLFLLMNLLLGNDILVKLETGKDFLHLVNDQEENISLKASVVTNPFCKAVCTLHFWDLSRNSTIENEEFTLRPTHPFKKEVKIKAPEYGSGVVLYRFDMECTSIKQGFCETSNRPNEKKILIAVEYQRNEEQQQLKTFVQAELGDVAEKLLFLQEQHAHLDNLIDQLNASLMMDPLTQEMGAIKEKIVLADQQIRGIKPMWDSQRFSLASEKIGSLLPEIEKTTQNLLLMNQTVQKQIEGYHGMLENGEVARNNVLQLLEVRSLFPGSRIASDITSSLARYDNVIALLSKRELLPEKMVQLDQVLNESKELLKLTEDEIFQQHLLTKQIMIDLQRAALCNLTASCLYPSMNERSLRNVSVREVCDDANKLLEGYGEIVANSSVTQNASLNKNQSILVSLKSELAQELLYRLTENNSRSVLIKNILQNISANKKGNVSFKDSKEPILIELGNDLHPCEKNEKEVKKIPLEKINLTQVPVFYERIVFEEPMPGCCVHGLCKSCCHAGECSNNASLFPALFVHGHSFNLGLSAEYSPEIFNMLQSALENDGFVNAGVLSNYNQESIAPGLWGEFNEPISIKVSYFFDLYKEPDTLVLVQIKNENLDTYAIRLKELIDNVKYRTHKEKVKIVAHSMGGLVVRRYIQIFGDKDVDRIIFLGTPHHGITEKIYNLCKVKGSNLACRDMKSDSLLVNKLNRDPLPAIPIYNIIGTGCIMDADEGDGIVTKQSAELEESSMVRNIIINGTCGRLTYFHTDMLDISRYPEVYEAVKQELS